MLESVIILKDVEMKVDERSDAIEGRVMRNGQWNVLIFLLLLFVGQKSFPIVCLSFGDLIVYDLCVVVAFHKVFFFLDGQGEFLPLWILNRCGVCYKMYLSLGHQLPSLLLSKIHMHYFHVLS